MEVEMCGDSWKVVKSVLIFIYTPVISISLASKPSTQRIELPYSLSLFSLPLLPIRRRVCSYFADNCPMSEPSIAFLALLETTPGVLGTKE